MRPNRCDVLLALSLVAAPAVRAGETLDLPTRIILTAADCKQINSKRTLRGRTVRHPVWPETESVLDAIQCLTGRKPDVINWFRSGSGDFSPRFGGRHPAAPSLYQYDILCSHLLRTGDLDIIRVLIWHAYDYTGYAAPDWRRVVEDKRFTVPERIAAWQRSPRADLGAHSRSRDFWQLFGDQGLTFDDILELHARGRDVPWPELAKSSDEPLPVKKARSVVLPLLRREYLGLARGDFMRRLVQCLESLYDKGDPTFRKLLIEKLTEWDALGDRRTVVLWRGLGRPDAADEATSLWAGKFMASAAVPRNAAKAFWLASVSPTQRSVLGAERKGWQTLFRQYLNAVTARTTTFPQEAFLRALAGGDVTREGRSIFEKEVIFTTFVDDLRRHKQYLLVTPEEHALLKKAWRQFPEALERVKVVPPPAKPM